MSGHGSVMKHAICCSGISKVLLLMNYPLMLSWVMAATDASCTFRVKVYIL